MYCCVMPWSGLRNFPPNPHYANWLSEENQCHVISTKIIVHSWTSENRQGHLYKNKARITEAEMTRRKHRKCNTSRKLKLPFSKDRQWQRTEHIPRATQGREKDQTRDTGRRRSKHPRKAKSQTALKPWGKPTPPPGRSPPNSPQREPLEPSEHDSGYILIRKFQFFFLIDHFCQCLILTMHLKKLQLKQAGRTRHACTFSALHRLSIHLKAQSADFWLSSPMALQCTTQQFCRSWISCQQESAQMQLGKFHQKCNLFYIDCLPMFFVPGAEPNFFHHDQTPQLHMWWGKHRLASEAPCLTAKARRPESGPACITALVNRFLIDWGKSWDPFQGIWKLHLQEIWHVFFKNVMSWLELGWFWSPGFLALKSCTFHVPPAWLRKPMVLIWEPNFTFPRFRQCFCLIFHFALKFGSLKLLWNLPRIDVSPCCESASEPCGIEIQHGT